MGPLELLIIGITILVITTLVFFPEKGLLSRIRRNKSNNERVLIEDSLKHIYDCEYNNVPCSINSIAGNLHVSADKSTSLVEKLNEMSLVKYDPANVWLTPEGRTYALRVIRIHRLWEKYLAEETSLVETEWHNSAELAEHMLSDEQADQLAAQIGNPVIDPHGDPIPTPEGKIKGKRGVPLSKLAVGEQGRIVHIEDEPHSVYSQIVASGIHNGMQIRMTEVTNNKLKFIAEGEEIVLSPLIAANLSVIQEQKSEEFLKDVKTLSSLKKYESARVLGISKACRGAQRRRMMDLGIVKGTTIKFVMASPGGDPVAYEVRGSTIVLRDTQAKQIFISKEGE